MATADVSDGERISLAFDRHDCGVLLPAVPSSLSWPPSCSSSRRRHDSRVPRVADRRRDAAVARTQGTPSPTEQLGSNAGRHDPFFSDRGHIERVVARARDYSKGSMMAGNTTTTTENQTNDDDDIFISTTTAGRWRVGEDDGGGIPQLEFSTGNRGCRLKPDRSIMSPALGLEEIIPLSCPPLGADKSFDAEAESDRDVDCTSCCSSSSSSSSWELIAVSTEDDWVPVPLPGNELEGECDASHAAGAAAAVAAAGLILGAGLYLSALFGTATAAAALCRKADRPDLAGDVAVTIGRITVVAADRMRDVERKHRIVNRSKAVAKAVVIEASSRTRNYLYARGTALALSFRRRLGLIAAEEQQQQQEQQQSDENGTCRDTEDDPTIITGRQVSLWNAATAEGTRATNANGRSRDALPGETVPRAETVEPPSTFQVASRGRQPVFDGPTTIVAPVVEATPVRADYADPYWQYQHNGLAFQSSGGCGAGEEAMPAAPVRWQDGEELPGGFVPVLPSAPTEEEAALFAQARDCGYVVLSGTEVVAVPIPSCEPAEEEDGERRRGVDVVEEAPTQSQVVGAGLAAAAVGYVWGGPFAATRLGCGMAYSAHQDKGTVSGDAARAVGDVVLAARRSLRDLDRRHGLSRTGRTAAERFRGTAWQQAEALASSSWNAIAGPSQEERVEEALQET